jgi:Mrp family chromosome partitioning ATPase/capsular polysaccharide biosynthesis protein
VLALGCVYVLTTPREYTAVAILVVDPTKIELFGRGDVAAEDEFSNSGIETEAQILRSGRIAQQVVEQLGLDNDPEFMSGRSSLFAKLKSVVVGGIIGLFSPPADLPLDSSLSPASEVLVAGATELPPETRRAMEIIAKGLEVQRVGLSYAISVAYDYWDPEGAARIANAMADTYLSDQVTRELGAAKRLSEWLEGRLDELRDQAYGPAGRATAEERSALRLTYDEFVRRYIQAVQQQSLPLTQAHVVTRAVPPRAPSAPNILLVLMGAAVFGIVLGSGVALSRDLLDRKFRSQKRLELVTQLPCIGSLPRVRMRGRAVRSDPTAAAERKFTAAPRLSVPLYAGYSRVSHILQAIKVEADSRTPGPGGKVIGLTSSVPREGKTVIAFNLARAVAMTNPRVLLIDGNLWNPTLSRALAPPETPGLLQMITSNTLLADLVWVDRDSTLQFLPAGVRRQNVGDSFGLAPEALNSFFECIRAAYDFVVVDLPAILPVVDVRANARAFDALVLVVEWGSTTEEVATEALGYPVIQERMLGTIFNRADPSRLKRYDRFANRAGGASYFGS